MGRGKKPPTSSADKGSGHVVKNADRLVDLDKVPSNETRTSLVLVREASRIFMILAIGAVGIAVLRWGATPLAEVIVGTDTSVTVNTSLASSFTANISLSVAIIWREVSRRKLVEELNELERKRRKRSQRGRRH